MNRLRMRSEIVRRGTGRVKATAPPGARASLPAMSAEREDGVTFTLKIER